MNRHSRRRNTYILGSAFATLLLFACNSEVVVFDSSGVGGSGASGVTASVGAGATGPGSSSSGGGDDALFQCRGSDGCTLVARRCCGVCGQPELPDVIAVASEKQNDYRDTVCEPNESCPGCASSPNPNLFASCVGATDTTPGQCQAFDARKTEIGACTTPDDCTLRNGLACCESCLPADKNSLVAIAKDQLGTLMQMVCDGDIGCPECAPSYPPGAAAICDAGTCKVSGLNGP
jgi:hypothetical protein